MTTGCGSLQIPLAMGQLRLGAILTPFYALHFGSPGKSQSIMLTA